MIRIAFICMLGVIPFGHNLLAQLSTGLPLRSAAHTDSTAMNVISFDLPRNGLNQLHSDKGEKLSFKLESLIVNKDTLKVKHIHVRGNTSSYYRRKCFNIKTSKKSKFYASDVKLSLPKFYAISMSMDRNYVRNKIAFEVLKQINIHSPSNAYSELRINNESEGLYLVFYPPDDYAIKILNSPFVIRRGYGETIDKVYTEENMNRETLKDLKRKYMSLYSAATLNKSGQELYNDISAVLDVDSYFGWLAFNHLFQNGDYADEVYLMWNSDKSKFEVVPWDFDDILKEQPHEGIAERQKMLVDKLVFSLEDKLDKKIAGDSFVYSKYLERYALLLQTLTPEKLEDILVNVYDEVYPYFLHPDIVAQSKYDQYGATDMDKLQGDLNSIYQYISLRSRDVVQHVKTASH